MTKGRLILIETICLVILIFIAFAFFKNFSAEAIFTLSFLWMATLFSVAILFIGYAVGAVIASLIKGKYVKTYCQDFIKWTIPLSLLWGFYMLYDWEMGIKYQYRVNNISHNEIYKYFYEDQRDENIKLVISKMDDHFEKGDYEIIRMRVLKKDTIINNKAGLYYDVQQIYYNYTKGYENGRYFARHIVVNKKVKELNFNVAISSALIKEQVSAIDSLVQKMLSNQTMASMTENTKNLLEDVIKLKE